jgi:hypothetical protein
MTRQRMGHYEVCFIGPGPGYLASPVRTDKVVAVTLAVCGSWGWWRQWWVWFATLLIYEGGKVVCFGC